MRIMLFKTNENEYRIKMKKQYGFRQMDLACNKVLHKTYTKKLELGKACWGRVALLSFLAAATSGPTARRVGGCVGMTVMVPGGEGGVARLRMMDERRSCPRPGRVKGEDNKRGSDKGKVLC